MELSSALPEVTLTFDVSGMTILVTTAAPVSVRLAKTQGLKKDLGLRRLSLLILSHQFDT